MRKLGIYVQVPFCQTKCTYCNFHTGVVAASRFAPYAEAVCREIRRHKEFYAEAGVRVPEWLRDATVDTVDLRLFDYALKNAAPIRLSLDKRDVNVQDLGEVTLKTLNHIDPERDIQFTLGPIDSLDHASRLPNFGSKMGIDATRKWTTEGFNRPWPDEILMDAKTKALVHRKWKELGIE